MNFKKIITYIYFMFLTAFLFIVLVPFMFFVLVIDPFVCDSDYYGEI